MAAKPQIIKARLTVPNRSALQLCSLFAAGEFSVVKVSPPYSTRSDKNLSNVYFELLIEETPTNDRPTHRRYDR